jgi:hypothetical protein
MFPTIVCIIYMARILMVVEEHGTFAIAIFSRGFLPVEHHGSRQEYFPPIWVTLLRPKATERRVMVWEYMMVLP